ncbi:MAG: baseplate J/gp47 family protein [Chloroflexota bacterium]|nr:baseplate J/gp47 family protein [Chloroflexota bacterium]
MPTEPYVVYLEPDDEITSVVRRVRETDAPRVVLVAPSRTKATSSAVALRLLAEIAGEDGKRIALVADPLARSLAAEAGLAAYASVRDATTATSDAAAAAEPVRRATINVVRGDDRPAAVAAPVESHPLLRSPALDETQQVHVVPVSRRPEIAPGRPARRRRRRFAALIVAVLALLIAAGVGAAVLPAATIQITPLGQAVGPVSYELAFDSPTIARGTLTASQAGRATGTYQVSTPATGTVVFYNFNFAPVGVPSGTQVAAGSAVFVTVERVVVGPGAIAPGGQIAAGEAQVGVKATASGPSGNVAPGSINQVLDPSTDAALRAYPNNVQPVVVENRAATSGGAQRSGTSIQQSDVDQAVAALQKQLADALATRLPPAAESAAAAAPGTEKAAIQVPSGLVGKHDQATFQLSGSMTYDRATVAMTDVIAAAGARLTNDPGSVPSGRALVAGSLDVQKGDPRRDGDRLIVPISVKARSSARIDADRVRDQVLGKSLKEAVAALDGLGEVRVLLWPGWVTEVPRLPFRVSVEVGPAR